MAPPYSRPRCRPALLVDNSAGLLQSTFPDGRLRRAEVAQSVEHSTENAGVTGSIPVLGTIQSANSPDHRTQRTTDRDYGPPTTDYALTRDSSNTRGPGPSSRRGSDRSPSPHSRARPSP